MTEIPLGDRKNRLIKNSRALAIVAAGATAMLLAAGCADPKPTGAESAPITLAGPVVPSSAERATTTQGRVNPQAEMPTVPRPSTTPAESHPPQTVETTPNTPNGKIDSAATTWATWANLPSDNRRVTRNPDGTATVTRKAFVGQDSNGQPVERIVKVTGPAQTGQGAEGVDGAKVTRFEVEGYDAQGLPVSASAHSVDTANWEIEWRTGAGGGSAILNRIAPNIEAQVTPALDLLAPPSAVRDKVAGSR